MSKEIEELIREMSKGIDTKLTALADKEIEANAGFINSFNEMINKMNNRIGLNSDGCRKDLARLNVMDIQLSNLEKFQEIHYNFHKNHSDWCDEVEARLDQLDTNIDENGKRIVKIITTLGYYKKKYGEAVEDFERINDLEKKSNDTEVQALTNADSVLYMLKHIERLEKKLYLIEKKPCMAIDKIFSKNQMDNINKYLGLNDEGIMELFDEKKLKDNVDAFISKEQEFRDNAGLLAGTCICCENHGCLLTAEQRNKKMIDELTCDDWIPSQSYKDWKLLNLKIVEEAKKKMDSLKKDKQGNTCTFCNEAAEINTELCVCLKHWNLFKDGHKWIIDELTAIRTSLVTATSRPDLYDALTELINKLEGKL